MTTPDSPEIAAAREAYRDACVAAFEKQDVLDWTPVLAAKAHLDSLTAAAAAQHDDEEALEHIDAALVQTEPTAWKAREIRHRSLAVLTYLAAAGFEVRRKPAP